MRIASTFRPFAGALAALVFAAAPVAAGCVPPAGSDAELVATPLAAAAIAEAEATMANATGRLWRIETDRPSHLLGTYHFPAEGISEPSPEVAALVGEARGVLVEVDSPAMEARLAEWMADPSRLFRDDGTRLSDAMTADEIETARQVLAGYGVPFEIADTMRPFVVFALLAAPPCAMEDLDEPGLDMNIESLATRKGVPVRALETVDEQLAALEDDGTGVMDDVLRLSFAGTESFEETFFLGHALYRTGHVGALWTLSVALLDEAVAEAEAERIADAFWERLIASRNRRMVERMIPALEEGGAFVAVGALHLPGEDGIVELLRARGYTVRQAPQEPRAPL